MTPDPLDTAASVDDDLDRSPRDETGRDVGSTAVVDDRPRRRLVRGMSPKRAVLLAMVGDVALTLAVPLRNGTTITTRYRRGRWKPRIRRLVSGLAVEVVGQAAEDPSTT